jgi:hypothetical protein
MRFNHPHASLQTLFKNFYAINSLFFVNHKECWWYVYWPCHQRVFNATTALSPDCQVNCIIKALGLLINRHFIKKCEMQCPRNWISNENVHFRTISDLAQHFFPASCFFMPNWKNIFSSEIEKLCVRRTIVCK